MTTLRENFKPVTDVITTIRRDFPLFDPSLADPMNALSLLDGEWMTLDAGTGKLIRSANTATVGNSAGNNFSWPLWAENGRFDVQALSDRKTTVIWLSPWEFETRIYDAAAVVGNGVAISTRFQAVKVASISLGGYFGVRTLSGLVGAGAAGVDTDQIVARVTRLPAENSGWLRIRGGMLY